MSNCLPYYLHGHFLVDRGNLGVICKDQCFGISEDVIWKSLFDIDGFRKLWAQHNAFNIYIIVIQVPKRA
jgi:hypothetical protein